MPVYSIIESEKQKKEQEARDRIQAAKDAMYEKQAAEQKIKDDELAAKYATDYAADREKAAANEARENERYAQAVAAEEERQRLQAEIDAKQYADLLEQKQLELILMTQMEEERTARLEAAIQSAISAGLRAKTPSVPANVPTPTSPRPPVPPSKAPPRRGYGISSLLQPNPAFMYRPRDPRLGPAMPINPIVRPTPTPTQPIFNPIADRLRPTPIPRGPIIRGPAIPTPIGPVARGPIGFTMPYIPRRGSGKSKKSKNVRTMGDLQFDLALLGHSL
jgi:hypothetical protein